MQIQRPSSSDEVYAQALAAFRDKEFASSIALCRQILDSTPDSTPAFDLLAESLKHSGGIVREISALKSAVKSGADTFGLYQKLGELQRVAGKFDEAIETLRFAASAEPDNPLIQLSLGMACYGKGDLGPAGKAFSRILELDARYAPAHYFLGNINRKSGRWPEAKQAYLTALELDPDFYPACRALAQVLFSQTGGNDRDADLKQAAELARRAIKNSAGDFSGHLVAGKILIELKRFKEAKAVLESAAKFGTRHRDLYIALSLAYVGLGEKDKARKISRRFMVEFPVVSRICASPEAQVLVLEPLYSGAFVEPYYGIRAYAHANTIATARPQRVTLNHILLRGINRDEIESFGEKYDVIYNNVDNAELNLELGYGERVQYVTDRAGLPVINRPELMDLTTRDKNYQRLHNIDHLIFPKTIAIDLASENTGEATERISSEFEFPVLVRHTAVHRALTLEKVDNIDALRKVLDRFAGQACYAIQYHESKHASGYFLRSRVAFIGGKLYPARIYLADDWIVSGSVQDATGKKPIESSKELQEAEKRWLADPESVIGRDQMAALYKLNDIIGLDCYGIDLGMAEDGRVIVFEANACMNVLSITFHLEKLPYLQKAADDMKTALDNLLIGKARAGAGEGKN